MSFFEDSMGSSKQDEEATPISCSTEYGEDLARLAAGNLKRP